MVALIRVNFSSVSLMEHTPVEAQNQALAIQPINRGFNAVIEATVEAKRYVFKHEKKS
jgi:hypothetical protein